MRNFEFKDILINNTIFLKPYAITLTHDQEKAKDLLQDTYYRALINKEKYQNGTNIKAWLYTIMRNIFINDYRKKKNQNIILDNTDDNFLINSSKNVVENNAISNIGEKEIWSAIHHLPNEYKQPFLMYFNGNKYQDIANEMHQPLGTIKSKIHFARKFLKQYLQKREIFGLN